MFQKLFRLSNIGANYILKRSASGNKPPLFEKYKQFQADDGIPVYLKGGFGDKILFQTTVILIAVGLSNGLYTIYEMAKPKKKR